MGSRRRGDPRPLATGDLLRWAATFPKNRNGAERRKALAIRRILRECGNGTVDLLTRHLNGGDPWDDLPPEDRTAIKATVARLRVCLQSAGFLPPDPRPGDDELPDDELYLGGELREDPEA